MALGGPSLVAPLVNKGILDVRQASRDWFDSIRGVKAQQKAKRVWMCTQAGKLRVDSEIKDWVSGLGFPRYYLDFETVSPAVPLWADTDHTRPFRSSIRFMWRMSMVRLLPKNFLICPAMIRVDNWRNEWSMISERMVLC